MTMLARFRRLINRMGIDIGRYRCLENGIPTDINGEEAVIISAVKPFTMTSVERLYALCCATRYVVNSDVPGAIVECGVWRGGSMMAVAKTLLSMNRTDYDLYLYDTFQGMASPGEKDVSISGERAKDLMEHSSKTEEDTVWCYASLESVRRAVESTEYPPEKIHFVCGRVEDTIPKEVPAKIALLRLDTDWYESTKHELEWLFPRLSRGGVLIIDDYGHWKGARAAVDEYVAEHGVKVLLNRIDYTGRIAIKVFD